MNVDLKKNLDDNEKQEAKNTAYENLQKAITKVLQAFNEDSTEAINQLNSRLDQ